MSGDRENHKKEFSHGVSLEINLEPLNDLLQSDDEITEDLIEKHVDQMLGIIHFDEYPLCSVARKVYEKYKNIICFSSLNFKPDDNEKKFYIYEWYEISTGKVFYVGKGTGRRYNHVLRDINNPGSSPDRGRRGLLYKQIADHGGVDYKITFDNLTQVEASIIEIGCIYDYIDSGEILLQYQNTPTAYFYDDYYQDYSEKDYSTRDYKPCILLTKFQHRYLDMPDLHYDLVDLDRIKHTTFIFTGFQNPYIKFDVKEPLYQEQILIRKYLTTIKGKVTKNLGKTTTSVIEFGNISYDNYIKCKQKGCDIYHSFDVIRFLMEIGFSGDGIKAKLPEIDNVMINVTLRERMKDFLNKSQDEILELAKDDKVTIGYLLDKSRASETIFMKAKYYEAIVHKKIDGLPCEIAYIDLSNLYLSVGLFEMALNVINLGVSVSVPEKISLNLRQYIDGTLRRLQNHKYYITTIVNQERNKMKI